MVSWPLDGLICCPSECSVRPFSVLTVWNLRSFSSVGQTVYHQHSASEVVYGCRQHLLLRGDPHRVGFLYAECPSNPLPREIWQRPLPLTRRPLLKRCGGKKMQFSRSSELMWRESYFGAAGRVHHSTQVSQEPSLKPVVKGAVRSKMQFHSLATYLYVEGEIF